MTGVLQFELESIVIGGSGGGSDGGGEGGGGASLSPRSSPRIVGTPKEKEQSSNDAIILERFPIVSFLTVCS
jgi:hypothetical protein